jgi:hypothetical protein
LAVVVVPAMPEGVAVAVAATGTMQITHTPEGQQQLLLEQEVQKEPLLHPEPILVYTLKVEPTLPLELHSLPSVVVVAEATKEDLKTDIPVDLVVVVPTNQVRQILDLVVPELQGRVLQEETHAAVAVVKSLAVAVAALAVLVLTELLVDVVIVAVDHSILELEEMVFRTQLVELLCGTPEAVAVADSVEAVPMDLTNKLLTDLVVVNPTMVVVANVKSFRVIFKQKTVDLELLSFAMLAHRWLLEVQSRK